MEKPGFAERDKEMIDTFLPLLHKHIPIVRNQNPNSLSYLKSPIESAYCKTRMKNNEK